MTRRLSAVLSVAVFVSLASRAKPQDEEPAAPKVSAADVSSAVAIFAKLGLPSVKEKNFVRFNTGQHWEQEGKLHFRYAAGWLVEEKPNEVELLTTGLVRLRLKRDRTLPDDWEKRRAEHPADQPLPGELTTVDFEKAAEEFAAGSAERYFGLAAMEDAAEGGMSRHADACLFAFWERQRRRADLATKLEALAVRALQALHKEFHDESATTTLEQAVAHDVAENVRWSAIKAANEGSPRTELVERWKLILALPRTSLTDEAKAMVDAYASLIDEDSKWRELSVAELEKAPPDERVAYWIHALRDLAARQMMQPGGVSVMGGFSGLPEHKTNPAEELVKLGWSAIPALIEGLADSRPTRCMGYWRNFAPGSYYLLTTGDCCQQIFEAITGEDIYRRETTSGAMSKDGRAKQAQKAAREWWDKVKATDERAYLVRVVSSGEADGADRASRLIARYPDAALAAIKSGIAAAKSDDVRAYLVSAAGQLEKDDPTDLLEAEAAPDRSMSVRIAATWGLLRRGHREALAPMIKAWEEGHEETQGLLGLLAGSGEPAAIRALGKDLARRPLELRVAVLESFGRGGVRFETGERGFSPGKAREPESEAKKKAWLEAIEDLLIAALDDETERTGHSGSWNGKEYSDPRVCDIAGEILTSDWPDRYAFDLSGVLADRDRQIAAMKNAWRMRRGLAPLDRGWRVVVPAERARVESALDTFVKTSGDERAKAGTELEALGLGGLAAIESRISASPAPLAAELEKVAARISCTVVDVVLSPGSLEPDTAWRGCIEALRGKSLGSAALVDLLRAGASELPGAARALRVTAERPSDGSGVLVSVAFVASAGEPSDRPRDAKGRLLPHAERTVHAVLGRDKISSLSAGGSIEAAKSGDAHAATRGALERCLASPHRMPFSVRATIALFPGDPEASAEPTPSPAEAKPTAKTDGTGDALPEGARARFGTLRFRHTRDIDCVAWSPDGKAIFAGDSDGALRVWDAESGHELRRFVEYDFATWRSNTVEALSVSPDGRFVAAGNSDGKLRVWDLTTGAKVLTAPHGDFVQTVAYSPDGKTIATGCWDGKIRIFDAKTGEAVRSVVVFKDRHSGGEPVYGRPHLAWTRDGKSIAVAGVDEKLRIWRVDGEEVRTLAGLKKTLTCVACSPDGSTVATAGDDQKVLLYDLASDKPPRVLDPGTKGKDYDGIWTVDFSPDGKVLACNAIHTCAILRWDVAAGKQLPPLVGSKDGVFALAFAPDGKRLASGARDNVVRVWDLEKGEQIHVADELGGPVSTLALSPDGKTLAIDINSRIAFADPETGKIHRRLEGHWANVLAFSPDSSKLVTGAAGDLTLWDATTGRALHSFPITPDYNWPAAIAFSPDGDTFVTCDRFAKVRFWSAKKMTELRMIDLTVLGADHLAFSPDGKILAAGRETAQVVLWDAATGEELRVLPGWPGRIIAFSPDGKVLASGGQQRSPTPGGTQLSLSDPKTGALLRTVDTGDEIGCLTYSRDGKLIAVGGGAGTVTVWDATTLSNVARFKGHASWVGGVAFSNDGRTLYSGSTDGTVLVWDVPDRRFR